MKAETQFENQIFKDNEFEAFSIYSVIIMDLNTQKILFLNVILILF
jgi:hypothetical protein